MNKKIFISTLLIAILLFISTLSLATDDNNNTMLQDGVNGVRNIVGGAENVIENAVHGAAGAIKDGTQNLENGLNSAVDDMNNNNNNENNNNNNNNTDNNNNDHNLANFTNNDNNGNYTATRTATFMGMDGNTWTWFIIGIVGIAIIALVWAYSMQDTRREHNHH